MDTVMKNERDIIQRIQKDEWMMETLRAVQSLNLPDWWVCAGFVRAKIWDVLHGFQERTPLPDIDVIYFDRKHTEKAAEKKLEQKLYHLLPDRPWSVKNQARMHAINGGSPYLSSVDAMSKFPETATALGVRLDEKGVVVLAAPWGVEDVCQLLVKPTPYFCETKKRAQMYEERVRRKKWTSIWHKLTIVTLKNA
ncbi:nucleotidyltransferase family protein [Anoxybacillus rupiensis]|jgi:uncharacterized protein|uniref:Nucleotidyltransferase family protein n=1 Tax=Anoxybacteroides rupiense TaxID=311460 RepID=A0ABT5W477_9BACL|nr:nucleotidyltransferase family protein [Anoxybacillus rupiensis]MDE8564097.1 nucleotidyltransferase family protein [Anoxybacillus rupiensis]